MSKTTQIVATVAALAFASTTQAAPVTDGIAMASAAALDRPAISSAAMEQLREQNSWQEARARYNKNVGGCFTKCSTKSCLKECGPTYVKAVAPKLGGAVGGLDTALLVPPATNVDVDVRAAFEQFRITVA